jgi:hypothetical protein
VTTAHDPELAAPGDRTQDPPQRLLAIDWATIRLTSDSDALALWSKIAPTGDDWSARLDEVPNELDRPLAIALLRAGNFACVPPRPVRDCAAPVFDVPEPSPTATVNDPCLRRLLAMWAIEQLEPVDVPSVMDSLRAIAALPAPESQLVTSALRAVPETDQARKLELIALAWNAGQRDLAAASLGALDEPQLIEAVTKHHIDAALEVLSAEGHRATYMTAVADDALASKTRATAVTELVAAAPDDKLAPDLRALLVKATGAKDCTVAAAATRALEQHGDPRYVPKRPRTLKPEVMMRALCVLASYEKLQRSDEGSLLQSFVPAKGLERIAVAYDALAETDSDGDGDPHTQRTADLSPRDQVVVPEIDDMIRALRSCKGTTCTSDDREFRFGLKAFAGELMLYKLEIAERPPCARP